MSGLCTCPFIPFRDDPYFQCSHCEARDEERYAREEIEDEENERNEAHWRAPRASDFSQPFWIAKERG